MRYSRSQSRTLLDRGVWMAPWSGPSGEPVLLVVTGEHKLLVPPEIVRRAEDAIMKCDEMWDLLDRLDPLPVPQAHTALRVL